MWDQIFFTSKVAYYSRLNAEAGVRIQLTSIKLDIKELSANVKALYSPYYFFFFLALESMAVFSWKFYISK